MQKAQAWAVRGRSDEYVRRVSAVAAADLGAAADFAFRPPRKLYRVSEVADCLGVSRQTIHNYATAGLIAEEGHTPGGQRLFGEAVFRDILLIQRLKTTHRLQEIRRILTGRRRFGGAAAQAAAQVSGHRDAAARRRERSRELLGLTHREAEGEVPNMQNPPAGAMTSRPGCRTGRHRAGGQAASGTQAGAVPEDAGRTAVGPDFAVRAPSDQPPSAGQSPIATDRPAQAGPASPGRSQAMPGRSPADLRHVKETPEDDKQRG